MTPVKFNKFQEEECGYSIGKKSRKENKKKEDILLDLTTADKTQNKPNFVIDDSLSCSPLLKEFRRKLAVPKVDKSPLKKILDFEGIQTNLELLDQEFPFHF